MKRNSVFTSLLLFVIAILLVTITSLLMTSCTGVKYTYFNKQKVPHTAPEETKFAKAIPAKPFLSQSENKLKEKISLAGDKNDKQKTVAENDIQKKVSPPSKLEQILNEINIAKYVPRENKGIQSENKTHGDDQSLLIVVLVVLIIVLIALIGDILGLLFLAVLVLLVYFLVKYLGVFN